MHFNNKDTFLNAFSVKKKGNPIYFELVLYGFVPINDAYKEKIKDKLSLNSKTIIYPNLYLISPQKPRTFF